MLYTLLQIISVSLALLAYVTSFLDFLNSSQIENPGIYGQAYDGVGRRQKFTSLVLIA